MASLIVDDNNTVGLRATTEKIDSKDSQEPVHSIYQKTANFSFPFEACLSCYQWAISLDALCL